MKRILTAIFVLLLSVGPPSAQAAERSDAEKQAIEKIEESGGTVREIAQNDDRLEVNFQLTGESVTDGHLAPVAELSNVYELRLGKTSVTDAGLAHIKGLSYEGRRRWLGAPQRPQGTNLSKSLRHVRQRRGPQASHGSEESEEPVRLANKGHRRRGWPPAKGASRLED